MYCVDPFELIVFLLECLAKDVWEKEADMCEEISPVQLSNECVEAREFFADLPIHLSDGDRPEFVMSA